MFIECILSIQIENRQNNIDSKILIEINITDTTKYQKLPTRHFIISDNNYSSKLNGRHFRSLYISQRKNNLRCVVCSNNDKLPMRRM